jgi:transcriptional regulator with XRE-family HTH domain
MSETERNSALSRIRTAMIEKKLTQAGLADAADCHEKTVQNLLQGRPVRDQTLFDVCMVLGLDFDEIKAASSGQAWRDEPGRPSLNKEVAPVYMGAYARAAVEDYVGSYLTFRPAFAAADTIVAYRTDVTWDADWPSLVFKERDRPDAPYAHRGRLYVPASSMFIHLVSLTKGAMRMIILSQLDRTDQMRGLITTLNKQRAMLVPVSAPIVYIKRAEFRGTPLGEIRRADPGFAEYRKMLDETMEQEYVRFAR